MNVSSPLSPSKRLWLLKHPFFRAPDLPPSRGQRERMLREAQRAEEFHRKHPWWPKLHAYEREMIRKIRFRLQQAGDHLASEDLWRALDLVDEIAGLPGVVAVVEELLGGREFEVQGYWVRSPYADPGARDLRPLIPFLLQLNPAAQGSSRLLIAQFTFKAMAAAERIEQ